MTTPATFRRQHGLVLITAVLIVAIVATIATALALGQQAWLRQTENLNARAQADSLRQSGLGWIATLLARDGQQNNVDHLGEDWAKTIPPLPAEGGTVSVAITDAQGLFNLNSLLRNGAVSAADLSLFQQILTKQGLDPNLANAALDWMDADSEPRTGGAEDLEYLARTPAYRAANQPFTSVEELRLVRGFTAEIVDKLRPVLTVLPTPTTININTAPAEVLSVLLPGSTNSTVQTIMDQRLTQPFTDVAQVQKLLPAGSAAPATIGFNTQYFLVTINIRIGRFERRSEALISRPQNQPATVLWHRLNPLLPEPPSNEKT